MVLKLFPFYIPVFPVFMSIETFSFTYRLIDLIEFFPVYNVYQLFFMSVLWAVWP